MTLSLRPDRNRNSNLSTRQILARRRRLFAGMEQLEDRRLMAIATSFAAGVLTFTGDFGGVSNDTVIIQSTTTAGTIDYDDGSGLGSQTQAGVTQVVFNAGGGDDGLIVSQPDPGIFAPAGGITFNGGAGSDTLTMAGGSAATFTSGFYNVSGPDSGAISYITTGGTVNVPFTGVELINDTTASGTFTTNTTSGNDNIVVEPGPTLPPVNSFSQGPVFIDGSDRDDHGSSGGGPIQTFTTSQNVDSAGWSLAANANIANATTRPHTSITGTGDGTVDFYQFTVTTAGSLATFDIDGTTGLDSYLALFDSTGMVLFQQDDNGGDTGSSTGLDSRVDDFLITTTGTYYIAVSNCCGAATMGGFSTASGVSAGATYTLHISLANHALNAGGPIVEVEPNQATVVAAPTNADGWLFIEQGLDFLAMGVFNAAPMGSVLVVGTTAGSQARAAVDSAMAAVGLTGTYVTGAALSTVDFDDYQILYVPSDINNVSGGINNADLTTLAARTNDIQDFVRGGGGLFALTEGAVSPASLAYDWLEIPNPFTITSFGGGGISQPLRKTPAAIAAGFTISDTALSNGTPYHNVFTGPAGFNGLDVFVLDQGPNNIPGDADDRAVTLGQGAVNQTIGGGITTRISGNFATLQTGQKPALAVNSLGGNDSVLVDGSVNSLDGLIAPLTINGGTGTNSLAITDSADLTGDTVDVLTTTVNGLASFPIPYSNMQTLTVTTTQGNDGINVDFTPANLTTLVTVNSGNGDDTFGVLPMRIRPSLTTRLQLNGGSPVVLPGDRLNLDMSGTTAPIFVDTVGGQALSQSHQPINWTSIETYDAIDESGPIPGIDQGDLYVRTTPNADYVVFSRGNANSTRVRVNNAMYTFFPTNQIIAYGREQADTITASNIALSVDFRGEDGNDYLTGGTANDWLSGGLGDDRINGSHGDNVIWGDNSPLPADPNPQDLAIGGNDTLSGLGGADVFYGGGGNDIVSSGAGNDYAYGGFGNDTLDGNEGDDRLYGAAGNDTLSGHSGNDLLSGGSEGDRLFGQTGNDVLLGGTGNDLLDGGDGNDLIVSGSVANESTSRTSLANTTTFPAATYTNPADNDAALITLLAQWGAASNRGSIGAITHDGANDDLAGGLGDDDFCWEAIDVNDFPPGLAPSDFLAVGYGADERFAPFA